jgi:hypothetical protein
VKGRTGRARRSEETQVGEWKFAALQNAEQFTSDGASGADDPYYRRRTM